ncbi:MAG TPA: ABC transporter ATP-binding protein [Candidatus Dormibacteraeota bacterium]|nr:ABC transporter ATP-binding protein [Candidatus Dormibacteraeota bacterium]
MLKVEELVKRYRGVTALAGVDLAVGPGEIAGLIGHNGAGKTTLVEIVAGLTRPDSGRVLVAGWDVRRRPAMARRELGLAPQEIALYPSATVRQNLRLFGDLHGVHGRALRSAVEETLADLQLEEVADRPVALLSGGQRRRAQTASALVHRPRLLLLDEPTAGADPATREALLAVVRDRAREGAAVLYTTHYLPELETLGATLAVMAAGRVVARGEAGPMLAALPSEVQARFAGRVPGPLAGSGSVEGDLLRIRTADPERAIASIVEGRWPLRSLEVMRPTLDDLYHSLAVEATDAA